MCSGRDCPYCSAKERWMRSWLDNLGLTRQQLRAALGIGSLPGTISSKERQLSLRTIMISRDEQEQIKWEDTFSRQLLASMRSGGPRGSRIREMLQIFSLEADPPNSDRFWILRRNMYPLMTRLLVRTSRSQTLAMLNGSSVPTETILSMFPTTKSSTSGTES